MPTHYLHLNSAKRDLKIYPNGNVYALDLLTPLKNITKVELISARIPNTIYNITNGIDALTVSNVSTTYSISLPNGFWADPTEVATEIYGRFNQSNMNIEWIHNEGVFMFYTSLPEQINITVNSSDLARLLGFPVGVSIPMFPYPQVNGQAKDLIGILPNHTMQYLKSPAVADFSKNDYIFLDVQEFRNTGLTELSSASLSGKTTTNMFTGLTLDVPANSIKIFKNSDYPVAVEYDPPISKISRLTIGWYDSKANLIQFQGLEENASTFRVTTKNSVPIIEIEQLHSEDQDPRPIPVKIPKPPEVKEKRMLGKWFVFLVLIGIATLWYLKKKSFANS